VWIDRATATVFFVTSHDTRTRLVSLKQQNNWKGNTGAETPVQAAHFADGEFQCISTRLFTPNYPLLADSSAGSPTLSNAGTANGNSASLASESLAVGDYFAIDNYEECIVSEDGTSIAAIDRQAKTITMSSAALATQSRMRIRAFRATPPPNSAP
jgi:hypothetical protein